MTRPVALALVLAASTAAPTLAQGPVPLTPTWTAQIDRPTAGPLGAHTHAAPDGDGGLYALAFASAAPRGLDVRLERFGPDGARAWSAALPGTDGRDDVPLALAPSAAGPCAAHVAPGGGAPGGSARTSVTCVGPGGTARWTAVVGGVDPGLGPFGLLGTLALAAYPDGGALVAAVSEVAPRRLVVVRLGGTGSEVWRGTYDRGGLGGRSAVAVQPLPDGGAVVATSGAGLVRVGADGAVVWDVRPDDGVRGLGGGPVSLAVGPGGDVVVAGHLSTGGMYPQPVTARYAADGALRWEGDDLDDVVVRGAVAFAPSGETLHARASRDRFSVTAVDDAGLFVWSGAYDLGGDTQALLAAVLPRPDGGAVLVGSGTSGPVDEDDRAVHAVAFDGAGGVLWGARRAAPSGPAFALDAALLGGGGVGVVGATSGSGGVVPRVVVFGRDGAEVAAPTSEAVRRPRSAVQGLGAADDGAVVFGLRPDAGGTPRLHLTRFDGSGAESWATAVPDLSDRWVHPFDAAPDGGAVVAGRRWDRPSPDVRVVRVGPGGAVEWWAVHDGPGPVGDEPVAVVARRGGAAVVAVTESNEGWPSPVVLAYGPDGSVVWSDRLTAPPPEYGHAVAAVPLGGGVLVAAWVRASAGVEAVVRAYDPGGAVLWEHVGTGRPSDVAATPDGGACYTGTVTRCLGPDGAVLWEGDAHGSSVAVGADGAVTVASDPTTGSVGDPAPLRLVRYGPDGRALWDVRLGPDLGHGAGYYRHTGLVALGDGYAVVAASSFADGYHDAGVVVVGPDGTELGRYAVPAAEPAGAAERGPRIALDGGGDLYVAAAGGGTVTYAPHPSPLYRAATYSVAGVARFDRSALPVASGSGPGAAASGLRVWPNPSGGAVTVALALPSAGPVRVAVYDALGRRVAVVHDGPLGAGVHEFGLDGSALPAGLYVVRATVGDAAGGPLVQRFAVVR